MNNKDREALDKFLDEDSLSPEDTKKFAEMSDGERATFIAERFFEAGAKHGRAELQEELLLYKEAARSEAEFANELTSILDLKKETIVEMQNAYETLNAHDEMLIATVDKLKEDNKKLVEALKFYDSYNSPYTETFELVRNTDDAEYAGIFKLNDSEILQDGSDSCNLFSGKLARQVLKEIGEE